MSPLERIGCCDRHVSPYQTSPASFRNGSEGCVAAEVCNSGEFREPETREGGRKGVGLANVRRRLALCYGDASTVQMLSTNEMTVVGFRIPAQVSTAAVV
jgi:LytS/YehU family sensor histidine kinase